jgi:hypothetical protein
MWSSDLPIAASVRGKGDADGLALGRRLVFGRLRAGFFMRFLAFRNIYFPKDYCT